MKVYYKTSMPSIKTELDQRYYEILRATAGQIEASAKKLSPTDTGQLKQSITTDVSRKLLGRNLFARVGTVVKHGVYQEFGTRKMKAHKFLRPSALENTGVFVNLARKILGVNMSTTSKTKEFK